MAHPSQGSSPRAFVQYPPFCRASDPPEVTLRNVLGLPREYPHVASWLFEQPEVNFRKTDEKISPELFKKALNITIRTGNPGLCGANQSGDSAGASAEPQDQADTGGEPSLMYMSIIPAHAADNIVTGYCYHIGMTHVISQLDLRGATSRSCGEVSRFAFDGLRRYILVYIPGLTSDGDLLATVNWIDERRRQVVYVFVPSEQYSFSKLPSRPLNVTIQDQVVLKSVQLSKQRGLARVPAPLCTMVDGYKPVKPLESSEVWDHEDVTAVHPNLLDDFMDVPMHSTTDGGGSDLDFEDDSDSMCASRQSEDEEDSHSMRKGTPDPIRTGSALQSPVPFQNATPAFLDLSPIGMWTEQIFQMMCGHFAIPCERSVRMRPGSHKYFVKTCLQSVGEDDNILKLFSARAYYEDTLAVTADMPLLRDADNSEEESRSRVQELGRNGSSSKGLASWG